MDSGDFSIEPVFGGFMHSMYKVKAGGELYAIKHLNPTIMKRPNAASNFESAERLERKIEDAGIPIVPALQFNNRKMQIIDGDCFYIFRWHKGHTTNTYSITYEQCGIAGAILGRMHAIDSNDGVTNDIAESCMDFDL